MKEYIDLGLTIKWLRPIKNKFTRARPVAKSMKNGEISILKGKWNKGFIDELKDFGPDDKEYDLDDQVDAMSIGFNRLNKSKGLKVYVWT